MDIKNANTLDTVTTVPTTKKLVFFDPDDNSGGIITLADLTKQILGELANQQFALDAGTMTLPAALNQLNSETLIRETGDTAQIILPVNSGSATVVIAYSLGGYGNDGSATVIAILRYSYNGTECNTDYIYNRGNVIVESSISNNENTITFKTQDGENITYVKAKAFAIS